VNTDPIVKEMREAGAKLAAEAGYDVHCFFENLREVEKKCDRPLVREPVARYELTGENSLLQPTAKSGRLKNTQARVEERG
jgi:hypothetical protein